MIANFSDLGGMLAVEYLAPVIQETQQIQFVNKFLSVIFQQFSFNSESKIIEKTADVFAKLVRMGGELFTTKTGCSQPFVDA